MAITAQYAATPKNGSTQIATANTLRDGTGTLGTVLTAGTSGSRIDSIIIHATTTTTAGMVRFFESIDGGTTKRLIHEEPVLAVTPSATLPAWKTVLTSNNASFMQNGFIMQANAILYASTNNAETFNVIPVNAGDF